MLAIKAAGLTGCSPKSTRLASRSVMKLLLICTLTLVLVKADFESVALTPSVKSGGSSDSDLFWANRGRRDAPSFVNSASSLTATPPVNRPRPNGFWVGKRSSGIKPNGFLLLHRPSRLEHPNNFDLSKRINKDSDDYEEDVMPHSPSRLFVVESGTYDDHNDQFFAGRGKRVRARSMDNDATLMPLDSNVKQLELQMEDVERSAIPLPKAENVPNPMGLIPKHLPFPL